MNRRRALHIASMTTAASACGIAFADVQSPRPLDTRRVVPVSNIVPTGASPIRGDIVKVEVIDAVDLRTSTGNWQLKVAVRIRNTRDQRVRCDLALMFDGELLTQPWQVDIPKDQSDLIVFSGYAGNGKGATQLSKLTAEARSIRIGD